MRANTIKWRAPGLRTAIATTAAQAFTNRDRFGAFPGRGVEAQSDVVVKPVGVLVVVPSSDLVDSGALDLMPLLRELSSSRPVRDCSAPASRSLASNVSGGMHAGCSIDL
mmetsp:Transcript_48740/g.128607  ORF Transcript_48740/g.128607 Transcript_48740/m.128607 type:complete len:110 (+) Transcript_48740:222-551(+)|eukprot:3461611-Prymnesium_polylepis.1